jgi:hypothetical protein
MTEQFIDFTEDVKKYPEFIQLMADADFCCELWTAFANVDWYKKYDASLPTTAEQVEFALTEDFEHRTWGASFRAMGGVIADLRNEFHGTSEDYMDWYCSNYRANIEYGYVTAKVREALNKIGWYPIEDHSYNSVNK